MSESGIWKAVESSCFDRLKQLISQQISRHNSGGSSEEAGGSEEACDVSPDGYGTPVEDWKRNAELVEEMEPKCSTYHNEVVALRQLELMEEKTITGTGRETLTSIQKDLEARQMSARKKVRCRKHRLDCVLAVFEQEADSIISQLESSEGTEVDFSTSNRVMRLKGMVKEAILTAENLGSARREAITVELIFGSCGLLRKLLSRLNEPLAAQPIEQRTALQPEQGALVKAAETVHPNKIEDDEDADSHLTHQIQIIVGCGVCDILEDNKTTVIRNGAMASEGVEDSATRETLADTSTSISSSSSSFSSSSFSSAVNSCTSARISLQSIVSASSFSFFRITYLDTCCYYSCYLLSSLLSLLSSFLRATSSERGLQMRPKIPATTPHFAQKLVNILKGFFKDLDKVKDEVKNHTDERHQGNAESCTSEKEGELMGSWIQFRLESVCERKSWHRMVHQTKGWMSSANARLSVLSLPVKIKGRGWISLPAGDRWTGWMISVALVCFVVCSLSIICFDQSPIVPIRTIGRMMKWIMFDPVVDLRHRGLPPI